MRILQPFRCIYRFSCVLADILPFPNICALTWTFCTTPRHLQLQYRFGIVFDLLILLQLQWAILTPFGSVVAGIPCNVQYLSFFGGVLPAMDNSILSRKFNISFFHHLPSLYPFLHPTLRSVVLILPLPFCRHRHCRQLEILQRFPSQPRFPLFCTYNLIYQYPYCNNPKTHTLS